MGVNPNGISASKLAAGAATAAAALAAADGGIHGAASGLRWYEGAGVAAGGGGGGSGGAGMSYDIGKYAGWPLGMTTHAYCGGADGIAGGGGTSAAAAGSSPPAPVGKGGPAANAGTGVDSGSRSGSRMTGKAPPPRVAAVAAPNAPRVAGGAADTGSGGGTIASPQSTLLPVPSRNNSAAVGEAVSEPAAPAASVDRALPSCCRRADTAGANSVSIKSPPMVRALHMVSGSDAGDERAVVEVRGLPLLLVLAPSSTLSRPAAVVNPTRAGGALAAAKVVVAAASAVQAALTQGGATLSATISKPGGSGGGDGDGGRVCFRSAITTVGGGATMRCRSSGNAVAASLAERRSAGTVACRGGGSGGGGGGGGTTDATAAYDRGIGGGALPPSPPPLHGGYSSAWPPSWLGGATLVLQAQPRAPVAPLASPNVPPAPATRLPPLPHVFMMPSCRRVVTLRRVQQLAASFKILNFAPSLLPPHLPPPAAVWSPAASPRASSVLLGAVDVCHRVTTVTRHASGAREWRRGKCVAGVAAAVV